MNERILELARQVWPDPNTSHVNHEKFAELIVRECAKVILETPVEYIEIDTMHRIRDSVKQHFGVGE